MQLRVARHTERLDEVVAFYRDAIGLPEVGGFRGHAGYDGVFLSVPGTGAHLELTSAGGIPPPRRTPSRCSCSTSVTRGACSGSRRASAPTPSRPPTRTGRSTG